MINLENENTLIIISVISILIALILFALIFDVVIPKIKGLKCRKKSRKR